MTTPTLTQLTARSGLDVLDHLDRYIAIPVTAGMQAQGDLIVIPFDVVADVVIVHLRARWTTVPQAGIEVLRSGSGGNPHTLIADDDRCEWTTGHHDSEFLTLGVLDTRTTAYLIHPEHGASGIAPGRYVIRRQREGGVGTRPGGRFVVD
ncbi:hypothetical protein ABLE92_16585 [Gordonia sp. VNQ95]|jgi:hypothetical protein|uniref:hypothetical protein n=1 Tax=Gordonia TaxID=2053 RepID=UPI0032B4C3DC